jgi:chorismate mutase
MSDKIIFAGPCSAETEEQVLLTAKDIAQIDKNIIYRAGIWKPRTRPNSFEGVGEIGLTWLKLVKQQVGLKTATEVATSKHVELALNNNVDVLWIGARTTVNPFSVQDIADAVKGTGVSVYVKNPIHPDIQLWIGAVERIQNVGIEKVGLIHRGFSTYNKTDFRNEPMWQIPIEMAVKFPDLPLICDPSHISGKRHNLLKVAQKAADLNFSGLMIETHLNPDAAWSDAEQQITPNVLKDLLGSIEWREQSAIKNIDAMLQKLRCEIDSLDQNVLDLLAKRMEISEQIGSLKKDNNIPILQVSRWTDILNQAIEKGKHIGLSSEFIHNYLAAIHQESINRQNNVMNHD